MRKSSVALLCGIAFSGSVSAQITDHGQYTHDAATGLYWADVTITQGLTYTEVTQRMQPGMPLEGWRYAIHTEVETLLQNFGIPAQGHDCYPTWNIDIEYCDSPVAAQYTDLLEDLIVMLGDTEAARVPPTSTIEIAPGAAGMTRGIVKSASGYCSAYPRGTVWLTDNEWVYKSDGSPAWDGQDDIRSLYCSDAGIEEYYGSFLVRETEPALPITADLDALPVPDVPPGGAVLFDNLAPQALDLNIECAWPYAQGPCTYDAHSFTAYTIDDYGANLYTGAFGLWLGDNFDTSQSPYLRIVGFDLAVNSSMCTMSNPVLHPGTRVSATDLTLYEGGYNWCRFELADAPFAYLPPLAQIPVAGERYIPDTTIDYSSQAPGAPYWGYSIDNVVVEFLQANIEIEFDPWRNNEIDPNGEYFATVDIFTTSVADGNAYDFDASTVDTSTLGLGPNAAPNVAEFPLTSDRDGDGDLDLTVGFRIEDTGISCTDFEIFLGGYTLSGDPLFGRTPVTPINCLKVLGIDVDPFNATNVIRPTDDYVVLVSVLTTNVADGEADDVDAQQVDPATLRFGPGGATSAQAPITTDIDGDSDTDVIFGFQVTESGIACGDTEVALVGEQYDGYPVAGSDTIVTTDCTAGTCHP